MEYSRDEGLRKYWDDWTPPYHKDGEGPPAPKGESGSAYNRNQDSFTVWENVFLVEAPSTDEAFEKAARLGRADEGNSGGLTVDDRPATLTYAGIRKLVRVGYGADDKPEDGQEVTYSVFTVRDAKASARLVKGDSVAVRYEE